MKRFFLPYIPPSPLTLRRLLFAPFLAASIGSIAITGREAAAAETAAVAVPANSDDGRERNDGNIALNGSGQSIGTGNLYLAFRFPGVAVPQGATIASAKLRFYCAADGNRGASGQFSIDLQVENSGNSAALATTDYNFSQRARLTGPNWKPGAWTNGQWQE